MAEYDIENPEGGSCDWMDLPCHLSSFSDWLLNLLLWVPRKVFSALMDGLASLLEAIPAPQWLADLGPALQATSSVIGFFADIFALGTGLQVILAALVLRFLIRRIPLIG